MQENALQKHLEKARKDQAKLEAEATPEERQILIANKRLEAKLLQNQEARLRHHLLGHDLDRNF